MEQRFKLDFYIHILPIKTIQFKSSKQVAIEASKNMANQQPKYSTNIQSSIINTKHTKIWMSRIDELQKLLVMSCANNYQDEEQTKIFIKASKNISHQKFLPYPLC